MVTIKIARIVVDEVRNFAARDIRLFCLLCPYWSTDTVVIWDVQKISAFYEIYNFTRLEEHDYTPAGPRQKTTEDAKQTRVYFKMHRVFTDRPDENWHGKSV